MVENYYVADPAQAETIEVGDRVRSYDTEFTDDFVEGVVRAKGIVLEGCPRYEIAGRRPHESDAAGRAYYPPENGTPTFGNRFTNFVRKLS
jgi:hypothetical protein